MSGALNPSPLTQDVVVARCARMRLESGLEQASRDFRVLGTLNVARVDFAAAKTTTLVALPLGASGAESTAPAIPSPQRVAGRFGVMHVIGVPNNIGADGADDLLEQVLGYTRGLLVGWTPPFDRAEPLQYRRSRLRDVTKGRVWWLDEYEVSWWLAPSDT